SMAGTTQVGRDAPGQLLGAEPVHEQRQVRAMLLDGAQREQDDAPPVTGEAGGFAKRQLGELEHGAGDAITDVSNGGPARTMTHAEGAAMLLTGAGIVDQQGERAPRWVGLGNVPPSPKTPRRPA